MHTGINRRNLLKVAGLPLLLPELAQASEKMPEISEVFRHGVASGDPDARSVVLWTRVSGAAGPVTVRWELATDADFRQVTRTGEVTTSADRDHTVKVLVEGLEPGATYHYRFAVGGARSEVGRTRTLPLGAVAELGLAVVSCSNFPFGHFNVYEAIARDDAVQFVLHLGDYIYEYGRDSWGASVGTGLGRLHEPANEIVSLTDYRTRHAQYKADHQSRQMHAAHPLLVIWDDHESANNPWLGGAENHQPETEGDWAQRRAASLHAWYEWMPVRDPAAPEDRARYWRHFRFGDLASLVTLETRHTARSEQIDYAAYVDLLQTPEGVDRFLAEIVGDPERRMLSQEQEHFVGRAMVASVLAGQPWRLLGNQVPMARTNNPVFSESALARISAEAVAGEPERAARMSRMGEARLPLYLDPWDGYPAARERLYATCRAAGAADLVVLTGDSHSFWQNQLFDAAGQPMGIELGTTGVTSPGDFVGFGAWGAAEADLQVTAANPEILWTENRFNGYVRLVLEPDTGRADFVTAGSVASPAVAERIVRTARFVRRDGTVVFV